MRPTRQNIRERLGTPSLSLRTNRHLRLYLRGPGVEPEALPGSRRLWLAEPGLKAATRQDSRQTSKNEVSQARGQRVTYRNVTFSVTSLRLRGCTGVRSGAGRRRARRNPTGCGRLGRRNLKSRGGGRGAEGMRSGTRSRLRRRSRSDAERHPEPA